MKTIEQKIAVMQAYADGKKIKITHMPVGLITLAKLPQDLEFRWGFNDYDIVEEPMEIYVNVYADGNNYIHQQASSAILAATATQIECKTIKFRQVMGDE